MDLGDPDELEVGMRKTLSDESETSPGYTVSQCMEGGFRRERVKGRIGWHSRSQRNLKKRN